MTAFFFCVASVKTKFLRMPNWWLGLPYMKMHNDRVNAADCLHTLQNICVLHSLLQV